MSGGGAPTTGRLRDRREQFRTLRAELPLPGLRDGLIVRPVENRSTANPEKPCQLCIGFEAEQLLHVGFCHVHSVAV